MDEFWEEGEEVRVRVEGFRLSGLELLLCPVPYL